MAPSILQIIVDAIITKDGHIQRVTSAYIDDLYIDVSDVPAARVKKSCQLRSYEQRASEVKRRCTGAWSADLRWSNTHSTGEEEARSQIYLALSLDATYFHYAASCLGIFLSVDGFMYPRLSSSGEHLKLLLVGTTKLTMPLSTPWSRKFSPESTRNTWCVDSRDFRVCVDASSVTAGLSLEYGGTLVEDACWLRPVKDSQHEPRKTWCHYEKGEFDNTLEDRHLAPVHQFCLCRPHL